MQARQHLEPMKIDMFFFLILGSKYTVTGTPNSAINMGTGQVYFRIKLSTGQFHLYFRLNQCCLNFKKLLVELTIFLRP